jgi:hypothetical protein
MTVDDPRDSDAAISPLMALLLGVPADSPRVLAPEAAYAGRMPSQ